MRKLLGLLVVVYGSTYIFWLLGDYTHGWWMVFCLVFLVAIGLRSITKDNR